MATVSVRRRPFSDFPFRSLARRNVLLTVVGLAALTGLSAYLRMRSFNAAFWIDEGLSYGISSHHLFSIPHVLRQDGSPPLYYMLLHVWMGVFGTSEATTHTLSLIFALLTIPVGYWAGRSLFSERAGWFVAVLFALNSYLTTYAQETRMYSLLTLLALVTTACFLHAFVFRRRGYLPVLAVSMALLVYTHNWGAFLIAATLVAFAFLVWRSDDRRALIRDGALAYGGALLLFAPWLPTLLFQSRHTGAPWSNVPSLGILLKAPSTTLDGDRIGFLLLLGGGAGLAGAIERRRGPERDALLTGLLLFVGTLFLAWLASQVTPAWAYRYYAVFVGPMLLIGGVGLALLAPPRDRGARADCRALAPVHGDPAQEHRPSRGARGQPVAEARRPCPRHASRAGARGRLLHGARHALRHGVRAPEGRGRGELGRCPLAPEGDDAGKGPLPAAGDRARGRPRTAHAPDHRQRRRLGRSLDATGAPALGRMGERNPRRSAVQAGSSLASFEPRLCSSWAPCPALHQGGSGLVIEANLVVIQAG